MKKYSTQTEIPHELIQLWETAWAAQPSRDNPMRIEFDSNKELINFRQHAYQARKILEKQHYPGSQNFMKLSLVELDEKTLGVCLPSWFKSLQTTLKNAGVEPVKFEPAQEQSYPIMPSDEVLPEESENLKAVRSLFTNPLEGESK